MSRKSKTGLLVAALGAVFCVVFLLGLLLAEPTHRPEGDVRGVGQPDIGGPFALVDHTGQARTQADFANRPLLIYFGFTYCPDVCPMSLDLMAAALDALEQRAPDQAARLQPLFISVDPARDSPDKLAEYIGYFHPRLIGLTGSEAQITAVKKAFRIYAARRAQTDANGNYNIDHSSFFYLMDGQNRYLAHFDHGLAPQQLADGLAAKLAR